MNSARQVRKSAREAHRDAVQRPSQEPSAEHSSSATARPGEVSSDYAYWQRIIDRATD